MNQVFQAVSQAVVALGLLTSVVIFLVIVYVLKEILGLLVALRTALAKQESQPAILVTATSGAISNGGTPQPAIVIRPETSPKATPEPVALLEAEKPPLVSKPEPICKVCKARIKKITSSIIEEGKTLLVFKCHRCGNETSIPSELVPETLA